MKYALSALLIAVLGFGGYVYVQVMPYPPEKRIGQLEKIPVAKEAAPYWRMHVAKELIDEGSPYGYISLLEEGKMRGDEALIERGVEGLRQSDSRVAKQALYMHDHFEFTNRSYAIPSPYPPEFTVLWMLSMKESLRHPMMTDEEWAGRVDDFDQFLVVVQRKASDGSESHQQVLELLRQEGLDV